MLDVTSVTNLKVYNADEIVEVEKVEYKNNSFKKHNLML